jgi:hypothetical protein
MSELESATFHVVMLYASAGHCASKLSPPPTVKLRSIPPAENAFFLRFSVCLSQACLGNMIILSIKWLQKSILRAIAAVAAAGECRRAHRQEPEAIKRCRQSPPHLALESRVNPTHEAL